jgi:hypothetical protein
VFLPKYNLFITHSLCTHRCTRWGHFSLHWKKPFPSCTPVLKRTPRDSLPAATRRRHPRGASSPGRRREGARKANLRSTPVGSPQLRCACVPTGAPPLSPRTGSMGHAAACPAHEPMPPTRHTPARAPHTHRRSSSRRRRLRPRRVGMTPGTQASAATMPVRLPPRKSRPRRPPPPPRRHRPSGKPEVRLP